MNEAQARRLGTEVAQLLAERLSDDRLPKPGAPLSIGTLDVRLTIKPGLPTERLAEQIAMAIAERLK